jgi:membrane-associated protein
LPFDLEELIKTVGYAGLFAIVFAESGLLFGIFLPGDSLLFTAGFLASAGFFDPLILVLLFVAAAVLGDAVGYTFGRRVGRRLYERPNSRWFKRRHLERAEAFYERHGGKAIVLARFVPIVRTLAPVVAGMACMRYRRFALYNVLGGALWGAGVTLAGYSLGNVIPEQTVEVFLPAIVALIVLVSALPTIVHVWRESGLQLWAWARRRQPVRAVSVDGEAADPPARP